MTYDDEVVAGGYVIRFVASDDTEFRGYDVNVTRPVSETAQLITYFLRADAPIPGIVDGAPVLLMGEQTGRSVVLVSGACPGLTPVREDEVEP